MRCVQNLDGLILINVLRKCAVLYNKKNVNVKKILDYFKIENKGFKWNKNKYKKKIGELLKFLC